MHYAIAILYNKQMITTEPFMNKKCSFTLLLPNTTFAKLELQTLALCQINLPTSDYIILDL